MVSDTHSLPSIASGLGLVAFGAILGSIHVTHLFAEHDIVTLLIGGAIPLLLAVALVAVGVWVALSDWEWRFTRRLLGWLVLGMTWMSVAGVGAIIYETIEGATLSHTWFLVAIFATYGAIPGLVTGFYDAQRARHQERLEVQEEAMESAAEGIAILDPEGRFRYLNDAHAEIYGYDDPKYLVGEGWQILYGEAETERFETEIMPAMRDSGYWRGRATGRRKDGSSFPQRVSLTSLDDGGRVCTVRDISGEVDRELALTILNRVLRHNLSNDMNVVVGQAERIRSRSSGVIEGAATRIEETGKSLVGLAEKERQIADLVLRDPETSPMALDTVLDPAVAVVQQRFPEADIAITGQTDVTVMAIPELERAIVELVENGVAHNDDEAPVVSVHVETTPEQVTLAVRDEGPGIPEQDQQVVAGEQKIDALFHASGLGLWYVYWVMRKVGGEITFEDRQPKGSEVRLTLARVTD